MTTLGERIAAARERRQVTQAQLAEAIGRDASAISRTEGGERRVSSFELGQIAEFLGADIRELLGIERTASALALAARVADTLPASSADQAVEKVTALLEVEGVLEQLGINEDTPPPLAVAPTTDLDSVAAGEEAAQLVRNQLEEPSTSLPADLPHWVESNFNVDVVRTALPEGMSGLCIRSGDRSIAVINQDEPVLRRRFTLAHELAHHIFQDGDTLLEETREDMSSSSTDPSERRANAFAASLLLPRILAEKRCSSGISEACVLDLMFEAGASWAVVVYRLHNLRLMDASTRDQLLAINPRRCAYRYGRFTEWQELNDPRNNTPRPPQRIVRRAVTAYEKGMIGIGPVAEAMMHRDREGLRQELADQGIRPPD